MPSEKPKIVIYTTEELIKKLDIIASKENRSRGNMGETIIREYIEQYEEKHGRVNSAELSISKIG